jgi:hypothetical protein
MSVKNLQPCKLFVYALLSATDLLLTYRLVQHTGGVVYESNPIANAWLHSYGWMGLAVFKLAAILLVAGVAIYVSRHRPATAARLLSFACCAVAGVVLYSCWLAHNYQPSLQAGSWMLARLDIPGDNWRPAPVASQSQSGRSAPPRRGHGRRWEIDEGPPAPALSLRPPAVRGGKYRFPVDRQ